MSASAAAVGARRFYAVATLALAVFTLYGSTIPFDFSPVPLDRAWVEFRARAVPMSWSGLSRTDVIANALLFVPFGFTLSGALLFGRGALRSRIGAAVIVLLISVSVSTLAEFLQIFLSNRTPSDSDVAAQTFGAVLGIVTWFAAGDVITSWVGESLAARREDRLSRLLVVYAVAWTFVRLAPFDITVDVGELAARFRAGQIAVVPPVSEITGWDVFVEVVSAIPLGAFVWSWGGSRSSIPVAVFASALWVAGVEVAQVFLLSHSATALDAILGTCGASIGVLSARRFGSFVAADPQPDRRSHSIAPALTVVVLWCLVLAAYHWRPYDFAVDKEAIRTKLATFTLIPFEGYVAGSYLNALNDFLTKAALAMPLGCAIGFTTRRAAVVPVVVVSSIFSLAVFGTLEAGQMFLPTRFPDVTDVLIGVCGSLAGVALARWLVTSRRV